MKKYLEILKKCPLFSDINDNDLNTMTGCLGAQIKKYSKKEAVFSEGEPARFIGIVLSGEVQIIRVDYFGNRSILTTATSSELFGESFACAGVNTIPVDVIASEDSEIMFIDCARITNQCSNSCDFHRQMVYNLMRVVARKNLIFHQKIEITSKRTTREKLMTYLLLRAKQLGSSSFDIPYDRQELADYLQVDRSGLSAEISKLRREGIIKCSKNRFTIL